MTEFERVVLPHLDAAHNLARWLVRDAALAQDVAQEAMLRAFSHFDGFRGGDARAWLLRIVRNAAYDALAARGRGARGLSASGDAEAALEIADPADDPEVRMGRRDETVIVEQALAALPAELRECVVLRELEEMTYRQIAEVTGIPIGTVMSRLWRGRRMLAGQLGGGAGS